MRIKLVTSSYPMERMGGAEYQTLLLAQGLAHRGHEVVFVATKSSEEDEIRTNGLVVKKISNSRVVGRVQRRRLIERAILEGAPEICYVRRFWDLEAVVPCCNDAMIPVVSMSCHARETTPFVLRRHPSEMLTHFRSFLSIRSSDVHACNLKSLQGKIQPWFPRRTIHVIYNGQPVPSPEDVGHGASGQVIWVNNLKAWKRPEIFVALAHRLPKYRFVMVGRLFNGRYKEKIQRVLRQAPANLEYLGPLPVDQVNALISQSDLLLYTSLPMEGFANSFLQAWFRGVPTVSLSFELDGILEREGIGRCSATFEQLVADVEELMGDETERLEMGKRAREYATGHHSVERMVSKYEALFKEMVGCMM